jgi:hypothetical protein
MQKSCGPTATIRLMQRGLAMATGSSRVLNPRSGPDVDSHLFAALFNQGIGKTKKGTIANAFMFERRRWHQEVRPQLLSS